MEGDPHRVRMAFGVRPKTSMISRSNQFATGYFAAIEERWFTRKHRGHDLEEGPQARQDHRWCTRKRPLTSRSSLAKSDRSRPLRHR